MDDDQQFCLRWNNHQSTLISVFDTLLENGTLVDCTLAAEGKFLKAHKVVLSACSPYFAALLSQQYDKHPIFILKDVKFQELRAMMDYMYRGEVNISQDQLAALLKAAESLQIKGLSDSRGSGGSGGSSQKADTSTKTHASVPAAKTTAGLTIEQKRPRIEKQHPATIDMEPDVSDSREGSTSPNSRKRKKVRRRSIETNNIGDNHDQHSNSSSHSMPHAASSTHSTSMPTITSATSSASVLNVTKKTDHQSHESKGDIERDVDDNGDDGADGGESHQQPVVTRSKQSVSGDTDSVAGGVKDKMEHSTHSDMLLEPKNEYDESNEGNVEDLTLDDEELLDDLEQAGPSHGGEGSSQGYAQWQIERSQDEVFMGGQDSAGQHRDAQGEEDISKESFQLMTYDASKTVIEKSDHCDLFLEKLQTLKEEDPELDFVVEDVESISMECETTKECINLNFSQPEVTHPSSLISSPSNVSSKVSSPTMRQLLSTTEGQMLKCMYESGKGELEGKQRVSISEFFIAREFENRGFPKTFTIDVKRFIQMRDEIHSEFPTVDKNLFFVPYEKETKTFAKGHLYKAFNNFKRNMGLTKAKKKRTDVTGDHDSSDAHDFVKHHLQPEETIKEFWTASRAERLEGFKTFYEYVIQYPILSTVKGYEYFLQDFEEEFPEQHNFAENWNKANKELTAYGLSKNSRFFKNLQKEMHEDLMGLHVLGFHLAVSSYSSWESNSDGTKRKRNKCSKQEVLSALFIYQKVSIT
ncbi:longitudinals lacking protein, isoforms J/P/Q/S/Z-like isoform X2 [Phlebotomus papatasi]|uniref:longitudinals lacking protein, isoforms J/P/Q/S/Z-like isoform X2 n=1 Tax=Phlebotomus papatasi TaxID=29031 RepID=UPI0024839DA1|nr:longitudinals lacking protein, isoforms J/P/Q/S/Z-like isoform X2 [Phlebotomus papatasi]XP_055707980.1 longitudinals lacking protein, isoforms J/P/Q/S/Z-like isoform X2 [Phlebotomus papatasi]XP_055707981.1 longitudinals lacking protein, isoforms J/P/Q/S/Z-like isoform X2 [Phlebotomus papatasi]